jgi:hypothetical protein
MKRPPGMEKGAFRIPLPVETKAVHGIDVCLKYPKSGSQGLAAGCRHRSLWTGSLQNPNCKSYSRHGPPAGRVAPFTHHLETFSSSAPRSCGKDHTGLVGPQKSIFHFILWVIIEKVCYQNCRFFGNTPSKPCNFREHETQKISTMGCEHFREACNAAPGHQTGL